MKELSTKFTGWMIILIFAVGAIAQQKRVVRVSPGFATVIVCPAPPELVTVGNMDAFSVQSAGNYVLIKPLIDKGTTNMFIKAGAESFNLLLQVSDTPDLEVRLSATPDQLKQQAPGDQLDDDEKASQNSETARKSAAAARRKPLSSLSPNVLSVLASRFKATNRYTYSVTNSKVIFAIDHMKQIKDKLFMIGTIINNSNVPYDVGYVRFKLIDYARSYLFWKKKIKETEMEPTNEYYNPTIKPHSSGRLLFVFDKHGFSHRSALEIKCNEENGRRDLVLEIPGSIIE